MSHPAEQIIDAVANMLRSSETVTTVPSDNVFAHRSLPLVDGTNEPDHLPAICINGGDDRPSGEWTGDDESTSTLQSDLVVQVALYDRANDEETLQRTLFRLRQGVQNVVLADLRLGLAFVLHTSYGGAEGIQMNSAADRIVGVYVLEFVVRYIMPSVVT